MFPFRPRGRAALGTIAAALMFCLMLLTCVDVVGRYFFNKPVTGGFELTEMLLAALIFAGLPLVTLRGDHITVDLFDPVTPDWLFRIQHALASLIGAACTGYLAWLPVAARNGARPRGRDHLAVAVQDRLARLCDGDPDGAERLRLSSSHCSVCRIANLPGEGEGPGA